MERRPLSGGGTFLVRAMPDASELPLARPHIRSHKVRIYTNRFDRLGGAVTLVIFEVATARSLWGPGVPTKLGDVPVAVSAGIIAGIVFSLTLRPRLELHDTYLVTKNIVRDQKIPYARVVEVRSTGNSFTILTDDGKKVGVMGLIRSVAQLAGGLVSTRDSVARTILARREEVLRRGGASAQAPIERRIQIPWHISLAITVLLLAVIALR